MKNAHVVLSQTDDGDVSGVISFTNSSYVHTGGLSIKADTGADADEPHVESAYMDMPAGVSEDEDGIDRHRAIGNSAYMSVNPSAGLGIVTDI